MNDPTTADDGTSYVFTLTEAPSAEELTTALTDIFKASYETNMTGEEITAAQTRQAAAMLGEVAASNAAGDFGAQAQIASVLIDAWFVRQFGHIPEKAPYLIDMYEWHNVN